MMRCETLRIANCGLRIERRVNPKSEIRNPKCVGGFTLLELLMVVIIIGILAAIALPQYIKTTERARASKAIAWLGAVRSAEMRFAAQSATNAYSNDVTQLDVDMTMPTDWGAAAFSLTPGASGVNPKGSVTLARTAGQYQNLLIGIQFGSGTICGTFTAYDTALAECAAD